MTAPPQCDAAGRSTGCAVDAKRRLVHGELLDVSPLAAARRARTELEELPNTDADPPGRLGDRQHPLTDRKADVLRAAEAGIPTDQIADRLALSPATVRNYLSNAISKVGGRNPIDAIPIARDAGWL
jgi:DNA-binding NarL/FixJ family response regulator